MKNDHNKNGKKNELVIVRLFGAAPELVFKAWSEPENMKKWWGPKTFTAPECKIDFRVGGTYLFCMRGPDGKNYWNAGIYKGIIQNKKIVYTDNFADENGNKVPASHYGMTGEWPDKFNVNVTFEKEGDQTKMTLKHEGIPAGKMTELCIQGWNESFDKLSESLK